MEINKLRVFTAFSGYDSQCMALDKLGIDYELVGWSEIDKYAIQAHNAVYPQWADRNYGDISKIDWNQVPDFDLFTYSFPCQDISSAGRQRGLQEGSGTRSSLLWECQKAIEAKRPKYCLMENVAALVTEKFLPFFLEWERLMARYGYTNYNKVLNAKDYKVPHCVWATVVGSKQANSFLGDVNGEAPCITSACGAGGGMTPMVTDASLKEANTESNYRPATGEERQELFDKLKEEGYEWKPDTKELVKLKWKPKYKEPYFAPFFSNVDFLFSTCSHIYTEHFSDELTLKLKIVFKTETECQAFCDRLNEVVNSVKP
jgi:DNA-cytosine methyltransferase